MRIQFGVLDDVIDLYECFDYPEDVKESTIEKDLEYWTNKHILNNQIDETYETNWEAVPDDY